MPSPVLQRFRIRQALSHDFNRLLIFYLENKSPVLPLESAKTIGDAIETGRILIVESYDGDYGPILASGSVFQLTPQASPTYVAELAGMRVTKTLGGAQPINVQMMLIGLRLLGHAALEPEPLMRGATNSIIAAVHKKNETSFGNLEAMQMHPLPPPLPAWLAYNQISWYGSAVNDDWRYYYADNDTIVRSLMALGDVGLFGGEITLHRQNRTNGQHELFKFVLDLNELLYATEDLLSISCGATRVALMPPPPAIVLPNAS
jgi:hypothetical protein